MDGALNSNISATRAYAGATGRDLHIDTPLTNMTLAYRPTNLIADQIYPPLSVDKETGNFYVWLKADYLRLHNAERARGAPANAIHFNVSSDTYVTKNYALKLEIPLEDLANADAALNLRQSGANFVVDQLALAWEDRLAVTLTTTTNMGSSTALSNAWNDPVDGQPVEDIFDGRDSIRKSTGRTPNVAIFSDHAWSRFQRHPDVIDFVRGKGDTMGGGGVTEQAVANAFGWRKVVVGKGLKNTASEGVPATYTDIWSNACILLHVAENPGLMVPSHGYTFQWRPPELPGPMMVERRRNDDKHVEVVEVHQFQDEKVTGSDLGYLIVGT